MKEKKVWFLGYDNNNKKVTKGNDIKLKYRGKLKTCTALLLW